MYKKILVPVSVFLIALATWGLIESQASLGVTSSTKVSVSSASLDFNLSVDEDSSREIDLGEVTPGDSGVVNVTINNAGTIPGTFCVERITVPIQFLLQPAGTCDVVVEPGSSDWFALEWALPISAHNTGMDGTNFEFSVSIRFENGYQVTKQLIINGTIIDPIDTPTSTPTNTPTETSTETPTGTLTLTQSDAMDSFEVPFAGTATYTPTPTHTLTAEPTGESSETPTPTETPTEVPTDTPVPPTETPTEVPTETPLPPTETPAEVPTDTPIGIFFESGPFHVL